MSDPDLLAEIKRGWAKLGGPARKDIDWLIAEVERLREERAELVATAAYGAKEMTRLRDLIGRLEWAGQPVPGTRIGTQPRCPRLPCDEAAA